jgi:hypothetical protein
MSRASAGRGRNEAAARHPRPHLPARRQPQAIAGSASGDRRPAQRDIVRHPRGGDTIEVGRTAYSSARCGGAGTGGPRAKRAIRNPVGDREVWCGLDDQSTFDRCSAICYIGVRAVGAGHGAARTRAGPSAPQRCSLRATGACSRSQRRD